MGLFSIFSGGKVSGESEKAIERNDNLGPAVDVLDKKGSTEILTSKDLAAALRGGSSTAGVSVSPDSAMRYVTVWACIRLLAESIAQMPVHLYRKLPDGSKERISDISLADILSATPNSWQTAFEYFEFMVTSLCLRGNHYSFINRIGSGNVAELIPLLPQRTSLIRNGYEFSYRTIFEDGTTETLPQEKIHHVRGLTLDGFNGVSPITYQRNAIGLGVGAENHGARLFRNGAMPAGTLTHPSALSDEAYARIRKSWKETHGGEEQGGVAVLEEGLKFDKISMSNEDAQYLEVRQFQRTEICSIYRVPPHMIGDLTKSSFSNITQQSLEMVKYTFLPWVRRIESAISRDLLTPRDRERGLYVEFLVSGLERADIEQRYRSYNIGIMSGILSPNECRAMENRNPRPGGDIYLAPLNMVDSTEGMPKDNGDGNPDNPDNPDNQGDEPPPRKVKSITMAVPAPPGKTLITKGVLAREQLRETFKTRFQVLAKALVLHENGELRQAITDEADNGQLGRAFAGKMETLYRQLPDYIRNQFLGLMREYAVAVRNAALAEIDSDHAIDPALLSTFVEEILVTFTERHIGSSEGQLAAIINETMAEELPAAIEQRLSEWDATRPEKIGDRESVQQESAVALWVWEAAGISKLQWQLRGSKSCPFCKALSGKIVGMGQPFIDAGDFTPEGHEQSPLKVRGPKKHTPLHRGCVCVITPVRD
ncbi:MAG: phage portal protein [Limnohabitans sp.]